MKRFLPSWIKWPQLDVPLLLGLLLLMTFGQVFLFEQSLVGPSQSLVGSVQAAAGSPSKQGQRHEQGVR